MSACPQQVVRRTLAAALVLALMGAPVHAQQGASEQKFVPSPFKVVRKAFDSIRERSRKPRAETAGQQGAGSATPPNGKRSSPAKPLAARLPKPRPAPATPRPEDSTPAPGPADLTFETPDAVQAGPPVDALVPPVQESASLTELPQSFAAAGLESPAGVLPMPPEGIAVAEVPPGLVGDAQSRATLAPKPVLGEEPVSGLSAAALLARVPRARPEQEAAVLALVDPKASDGPAPVEPTRSPDVAVDPDPDDPACMDRLRKLNVVFTPEPPMGEGACHVPNPLKVSSVGSGVAIKPEAILNCRTAEALALWVKESMIPAARSTLNAVPEEIVHGSTYVCRPRNNLKGGKFSEHAQANAVDIAAIGFADRPPVEIKAYDSSAPEARFADAIRKGSCSYFTTSLGPGSDAAHATHFHFDMAERRRGYRLCDMGNTTTVERTPKGLPDSTERREPAQ